MIALSRLSFLRLRNGQIPSQADNRDPDQLSLFGLLIRPDGAPFSQENKNSVSLRRVHAYAGHRINAYPAREVIYETVAHPLLRRGIACFAHGSAVVGAENGIVGVAST